VDVREIGSQIRPLGTAVYTVFTVFGFIFGDESSVRLSVRSPAVYCGGKKSASQSASAPTVVEPHSYESAYESEINDAGRSFQVCDFALCFCENVLRTQQHTRRDNRRRSRRKLRCYLHRLSLYSPLPQYRRVALPAHHTLDRGIVHRLSGGGQAGRQKAAHAEQDRGEPLAGDARIPHRRHDVHHTGAAAAAAAAAPESQAQVVVVVVVVVVIN